MLGVLLHSYCRAGACFSPPRGSRHTTIPLGCRLTPLPFPALRCRKRWGYRYGTDGFSDAAFWRIADRFFHLHARDCANAGAGAMGYIGNLSKPRKPDPQGDGDRGRLWCGSHCGGTKRGYYPGVPVGPVLAGSQIPPKIVAIAATGGGGLTPTGRRPPPP